MKKFLVFLLVFLVGVNDVLACGGGLVAPPTNFGGVELMSVFEIPFKKSTIGDFYEEIYDGKFSPNQIICKANFMYDEETNSLIPLITFSVFYRPDARVSLDAECADSKKDSRPKEWYSEGYRFLGSGVEPHPDLIWLSQWKDSKTLPYSTFKWCKASKLSYQIVDGESVSYTSTLTNGIFELNSGLSSFSLVSRDVSCTNSMKVKESWVRYPWKIVTIK